jgi:hypothetical protein
VQSTTNYINMTVIVQPRQTVQSITLSQDDLLDTARVQIESFDSMTEFQDVVEPHPRPAMNVRVARLASRIGRKLGADPKKPATHIGYRAVSEDGQTIGIAYWRRPGFSYKPFDASKLTAEEMESWKGMDTKMYDNLYVAFQGKMDEVLAEKKESGCW